METEPSFLFDALVLPDGEEAVQSLVLNGLCAEYIKDQYRHCKTLLAFGASNKLLESAGVEHDVEKSVERFIIAMGRHRHFERETDPPAV